MENPGRSDKSYWNLIERSEDALARGDFALAETLCHEACARRESSPGRRFLSEKISDGLVGVWRRARGERDGSGSAPGRWEKRRAAFGDEFLRLAEARVREGLRISELRPEDDAEANQPVLESALYLVSRSRLFREEPASAVPLLKALFRTARRTAQPFDVHLVRHDIPLTEEDRLWLARRGGEILEAFVEQGRLERASGQAEEWAAVLMQLLQARYFGSTGRLEQERSWLEAVTADRFLDRGAASVALYRAYLDGHPEPDQRSDEARVRLLEMLGNTDGAYFPVPLYGEALTAMQSAGLSEGSEVAGRYEAALARIEHRRPEIGGDAGASLAWATLSSVDGGEVSIVYWWGAQPRDVASWKPGDDPAALTEFLEPCCGRLVAADPGVPAALGEAWPDDEICWTVQDFAAALLPGAAAAANLEDARLLKIALAEAGAWRNGWQPAHGHPALEPPRSSALLDSWQGGPASRALLAGLVWLGVRSRVAAADPCLRAGIGELGRRGDPAAGFLYDFLVLEAAADAAVDESFAPWTLPLLWTRPDPFTRSRGGGLGKGGSLDETPARPDLGRNDLAIVTTGDPAPVLVGWNDGRARWRIVLDRPERLGALAGVDSAVIGPSTLLPPDGRVHSLEAALELLESMLGFGDRPVGRVDGLLPVLHWCRLVETHNGDLLDILSVRSPEEAAAPLFARYRELVDPLLKQEPRLDQGAGRETWAGQFGQRVRKSGLVVGTADLLEREPADLDGLWGTFEGSDVSWVWLDSAAIHARLAAGGPRRLADLHAVLQQRGRRHLSLLTGAAWHRSEVEGWLAARLAVYGDPYCLALTDLRTPTLRLAAAGAVPGARILERESLLEATQRARRTAAETGSCAVLAPAGGRGRDFWSHLSQRAPSVNPEWALVHQADGGDAPDRTDTLLVPVLASLETWEWPLPAQNTREGWAAADAGRVAYRDRLRRDCALEIAGLLAGPWRTVEVLDPRWLRLFAADPCAAAGQGENGHPVDAAAIDGARTFPLTEPGKTVAALPDEWIRELDGWLERLADGAIAPTGGRAPAPGVRLAATDPDSAWEGLSDWLIESWERAGEGRRVLVVADEIPAPAAEAAATAGGAGFSVWPPESGCAEPGPVLWCRARDFADPRLGRVLADHPPALVFAAGVDHWLPGSGGEALDGAQALQRIVASGADSISLLAAAVEAPWVRFLGAVCGSRFVAEEGAEVPEEPAAVEVEKGQWLDCGEALTPAAVTGRLRTVLGRLREVVDEGLGLPPDPGGGRVSAPAAERLLPLDWLGRLAGLSPQHVAAGARTLRWGACLAGEPLSRAGEAGGSAADEIGGHALLIGNRFAELESLFVRLREHLRLVLPLWLAPGRPGRPVWVDLARPPVHLDTADWQMLDRLLLALGGEREQQSCGLAYAAPAGVLRSSRRLVRCDENCDRTLENIESFLDRFLLRVGDVMASAVETGDGFRVETGLADLRESERSFLALGAALGLWHWTGPPCAGAMHLVDLLTLADSPTAVGDGPAWTLLAELVDDGAGAGTAASETAVCGDSEGRGLGRKLVGGLRSWLPEQNQEREQQEAAARIDALLDGADTGQLVLRGLAGSGRHAAVLAALADRRAAGRDVGHVTFWCPDTAVAAGISRAARRVGLTGPLDLRTPRQQLPASALAGQDPGLADPSGEIVVLCEIQRFDPELRYQVAQLGRGRRLILTVDPAASEEPWEHLFLTTPRAADVVEFPVQTELARRPWSVVREMVPPELQGRPGSANRSRGLVTAEYSANLDHCLARLYSEHEQGRLPDRIRLIGSLAGDLDYLGTCIRERGWLSVADKSLDLLVQTGPSELLAAATDTLARQGELARAFDPGLEDAPPVLPRLLGARGARAACAWLNGVDTIDRRTPLTAFADSIATEPWAQTVLAHPEAAARWERLLENWGELPLASLLEMPLWEAWWYTQLDDLGLPGPERRRPLVAVAASARPAATGSPGGVYLCLGTEPPRQHYQVLARVTGSALVLYQEMSPLPGDDEA